MEHKKRASFLRPSSQNRVAFVGILGLRPPSQQGNSNDTGTEKDERGRLWNGIRLLGEVDVLDLLESPRHSSQYLNRSYPLAVVGYDTDTIEEAIGLVYEKVEEKNNPGLVDNSYANVPGAVHLPLEREVPELGVACGGEKEGSQGTFIRRLDRRVAAPYIYISNTLNLDQRTFTIFSYIAGELVDVVVGLAEEEFRSARVGIYDKSGTRWSRHQDDGHHREQRERQAQYVRNSCFHDLSPSFPLMSHWREGEGDRHRQPVQAGIIQLVNL